MVERLDANLLDELRAVMEEEFDSLLEAYLKDSERRCFEVSEAWEAGDLEALRRSAHSLKGASSNIGAAALAELCASLEHLARDSRVDCVPQVMERVKVELQEVREDVARLRGNL